MTADRSNRIRAAALAVAVTVGASAMSHWLLRSGEAGWLLYRLMSAGCVAVLLVSACRFR